MTARRGYEANTCVPSKRTLLSIHTLIPNGPWMCFLGLVFNGHLYNFSQTLPLLLYFGYFCIILFFFASLYFSLFQYVDLYNQLGNGMTPPPPLLEKFPNNHVDQDQGGSMSRNTFNTWSAVRTKQTTV